MKIVIWTVAWLLVTFNASSDGGRSVALPESSAGEHFPSVKASNLEKRDFNLPADFEGERNLLLVAFEREQQKDVDTWLREMKRFEEIDPGFHYYELPTIQRPNAFMLVYRHRHAPRYTGPQGARTHHYVVSGEEIISQFTSYY